MTLTGLLTTDHHQTREAVFTGTTVPVEQLFEALAAGHTLDQFLEDYPSVDRKQVLYKGTEVELSRPLYSYFLIDISLAKLTTC